MTIRKGLDWGTLAPPPAALIRVHDNAELRAHIVRAREGGVVIPAVGLLGGDLMRTVGGSGDEHRLDGDEAIALLPVDAVKIIADGTRTSWFGAHCVMRRSWWRGEVLGAFNAQFRATWDVAPRAHPGDGRIDVVRIDPACALRQRLIAHRRVKLGTHVPHPQISIRQLKSVAFDWEQPRSIWLDGQRWGRARHVELEVEPDAYVVCV